MSGTVVVMSYLSINPEEVRTAFEVLDDQQIINAISEGMPDALRKMKPGDRLVLEKHNRLTQGGILFTLSYSERRDGPSEKR